MAPSKYVPIVNAILAIIVAVIFFIPVYISVSIHKTELFPVINY